MTIDEILDGIYEMPNASKAIFRQSVSQVGGAKGQIVIRADKIEKYIYFIKKGIVRAYSDQGEGETTFWFGKEGDAVLSMASYVQDRPGYENIELLEQCELYRISSDDLQKLFAIDLNIANWGRKLAEKELVKAEKRLISLQFKNASERYRELLDQAPELIRRIQLGHIASYLGITQVSLSRIRAELK